jgi:hypothetical protein
MLWTTIVVTGLGILLSLRFRVAALMAASLALAVVSFAVIGQRPFLPTLALTYALVMALQVGYLVRLALVCAWSRFATTSGLPAAHGAADHLSRSATTLLMSKSRSSPSDQRRT